MRQIARGGIAISSGQIVVEDLRAAMQTEAGNAGNIADGLKFGSHDGGASENGEQSVHGAVRATINAGESVGEPAVAGGALRLHNRGEPGG